MNQSIAVSHLQLEVEDATSICIQLVIIRVQAKGKDQVPFAGAVLPENDSPVLSTFV